MILTATKYIAKIEGTDPKLKFSRIFLGEKVGQNCEAVIEEAGLYDSADEFFIASFTPAGKISRTVIDSAVATKLARRMDAGDSIDWRREALPHLIDICKANIRKWSPRPGGGELAKKWQEKLAAYEAELNA